MSEITNEQQHQEESNKAFAVEDMANYRDGFKNLMRLVIVQAILMVLIGGFDLYYIHKYVPQDSYYAVSPGGTKRALVGLDIPNANTDAIARWAGAAVTEILTFGFNDIDDRMTKAQRLFSPEGWSSFSEALFSGKALKKIINEQQILSTIPISTPTLLIEGMVVPGEWGWVMECPVVITVRAGAAKQTLKPKVRLIIVRMPTGENPMGLGIRTFLAN